MTVDELRRAIGVFAHYEDAEAAFNQLRQAGFSLNHLSIIAPDLPRTRDLREANMNSHLTMGDAAASPPPLRYTTDTTGTLAGEGAATGAVAGGTVGGFIGLLQALVALSIPGIGPVLAGGTVATILLNTLAGGAIGAATGGLVGALAGLGIPEERAVIYNDRLSQGHYLLIVEGSVYEIERAEEILTGRGIQEWGIYRLPGEPLVNPAAMPVVPPVHPPIHPSLTGPNYFPNPRIP
ncbi:general stress protein [Laspinema sp. A4]|uniref:general stress protein n=1 Tax=Laspinema sp. D2d TaxID=2953686 RepID=UPI0021BAA5F0|nr:general stress protein [Laspinema sp. D2d]MCT7984247.1 general stress protein [Laspinema sp. D2d]